jgi:hypothetical protein
MSSGDESPSVIQIERFAHAQFYIAFARHMEEAPVTSPRHPPHFDGGPETVAELADHYRLKDLAGQSQGRSRFGRAPGTKAN